MKHYFIRDNFATGRIIIDYVKSKSKLIIFFFNSLLCEHVFSTFLNGS